MSTSSVIPHFTEKETKEKVTEYIGGRTSMIQKVLRHDPGPRRPWVQSTFLENNSRSNFAGCCKAPTDYHLDVQMFTWSPALMGF